MRTPVDKLAELHLAARLVNDGLLRQMMRALGPQGVVIRENGNGWDLYHKGAAITLQMSPDGNVYIPDDVAPLTSVYDRSAQEDILEYFNSYLPQSASEDTLQYVRGNLLTSDCDVIAHGCNCFNSMSGGIARAIAKMYPRAEDADNETEPEDLGKLGGFSMSRGSPDIFNLYTQYEPGNNIDYGAVHDAFKALHRHLKGHGLLESKIGIPKIGAGIAGGDWGKISHIIENMWGDEGKVYVYVI